MGQEKKLAGHWQYLHLMTPEEVINELEKDRLRTFDRKVRPKKTIT